MISNEEKKNLKKVLSETLVLLCKNGLSFKNSFSMEALIGVTLDENDVVLFSLHETISESSDIVNSTIQKLVESSVREPSDDISNVVSTRAALSEQIDMGSSRAKGSCASAPQLLLSSQQIPWNRLNPERVDVDSEQQSSTCNINLKTSNSSSATLSQHKDSMSQSNFYRQNERSQTYNIKKEPSDAATQSNSSNWMDEPVAGCSSNVKQETESKYSAERRNDGDDCIVVGDEEQLEEDEFVEEEPQYEEDDVGNESEWMEAGEYYNDYGYNYEGTSGDQDNVEGFVDSMDGEAQDNHFCATTGATRRPAAAKTSSIQRRSFSRGGHRGTAARHSQQQEGSPADRVKAEISGHVLSDIMSQAVVQQILQCPICGRTFTYRSNLTHHVNVMHLHNKRYQCNMCGMTFKWHSGLGKHKRSPGACRPGAASQSHV